MAVVQPFIYKRGGGGIAPDYRTMYFSAADFTAATIDGVSGYYVNNDFLFGIKPPFEGATDERNIAAKINGVDVVFTCDLPESAAMLQAFETIGDIGYMCVIQDHAKIVDGGEWEAAAGESYMAVFAIVDDSPTTMPDNFVLSMPVPRFAIESEIAAAKTPTVDDLASGKEAWANGVKIIGEGSGGSDIVPKTLTANGTYDATDEGYDGYNPVTVNVSVTPPEPTGYVRPTGVPNGEVIIANAPDIEKDGVTYKPIYYLCDMDTFNSITFSKKATGRATGADAYVFSDEPSTLYVGTSVAHTFDSTKDFQTSEEWNCRYIIMYATAANKASVNGITVNLYKYRATFEMIGASGTIFSNTTALFGYSSTPVCLSIKYVDISSCSFYNNIINADAFMGNCGALKEIKLPESITTVSSYFCQSCYSLTSLSLPNLTTVGDRFCRSCDSLTSLSLPNLTTVSSYFCLSCYSLTSLSLPKLTTVSSYFCQSCYSLTSLSLPKLTTVSGRFCYECYSLSYVDLSAVNSLTNTTAETLDYCRYITLPIDFDISGVNFTGATGYTKSLDWLNNELPTKLKDNSGDTAKTMTLGAANIALIGATAAATIAAKNWTIS